MASSVAKAKGLRVALVGAETLLGRELQDVFGRGEPRATVVSYAANGEGTFGEEEGEAAYVEPLTAESLRHVSAVVLAGSAEGAAKAYQLVKPLGGRPVLIDCTGYLEQQPEARIVAPSLDVLPEQGEWLFVVAHAAAIAIADMMRALSGVSGIRQAIFEIFEPASERGKRGITELHEQTTGLLAFKPLKKAVFDAQLSYNLLSQYGDEAPEKLMDFEARIERNLATLMSRQKGGVAPVSMPSLRLIQAPVFHGYSISAWVKFESRFELARLEHALTEAGLDVRGAGLEAPTNVSMASQSGLAVGDIRVDRNDAGAVWLWMACDNLRLIADEAAAAAKRMAAAAS